MESAEIAQRAEGAVRNTGGFGDSPGPDLRDPLYYVNRELSWLEFNQRVLAEAFDDRNRLLERVKFLAIASSNLDELYMVRISGLKQQVAAGVTGVTPDAMTARRQLEEIAARARPMMEGMTRCFTDALAPMLEKEGIGVVDWEDLDDEAQAHLTRYFGEELFPVLTPLAVDPGHPFPYISNLSLNLAVSIRDPESGDELFARVKVPNLLPRFVRVPDSDDAVPLEQVCAAHLGLLFPGMEVLECHPFRVTRDSDIAFEDDEAEDLLQSIEEELRKRRFRSVVRLEVTPTMPERIRTLLERELEVSPSDVVEIPGLLGLADLFGLVDVDRPDLLDPPWTPVTRPELAQAAEDEGAIFDVVRRGDVFLHHPYDSFTTSVEAFVAQAVDDPDVLAIKQTLYRTTENSVILASLIRAAEAGKQVVVVVELQARFDEERNIQWARRLEAVGAHVVYGIVGFKTHAKACLVVRHEPDGIRRYVHVGTGNYNANTARTYEDLGLLSCRPALGADLSDLFNFLTGYSRQREYRRIIVAPYGLRDGILARIEREIAHVRSGRPARIELKLNSLLDARIIAGLYRASQEGVDVDVVVRGICSLRPGIPGVSERIRVRSIIGRFLEHSRIYHFHNDGRDEYLIGSPDLMPRNLDRRVESLIPVEDPGLQAELQFILDTCLADNRQAWILDADGHWHRVEPDPDHPEVATHTVLMARAKERSAAQHPPV